jgi:hypothetical protein
MSVILSRGYQKATNDGCGDDDITQNTTSRLFILFVQFTFAHLHRLIVETNVPHLTQNVRRKL